MYKNKLVAAVKTNGKVLREDKDTVFLPFGSEYSLLIKNLDTVRAQASITIDGTDVMGGETLVIPANGEVDIERFIKNGNQNQGNRFKFIERTASIEEHRGVGAVDGLIQVTFQFEKRKPVAQLLPPKEVHVHHYYPYHHTYGGGYWLKEWYDEKKFFADRILCSSASLSATSQVNPEPVALRSMSLSTTQAFATSVEPAIAQNASLNDVGITVEGSISDQKFVTVEGFELEEEKHTIVLQIKGQVAEAKVAAPITVKTKPKCKTCGKTNKANAKFCTNCGTSLQIV